MTQCMGDMLHLYLEKGKDTPRQPWILHRLTLQKGVYSFRYFLSPMRIPTSIIICLINNLQTNNLLMNTKGKIYLLGAKNSSFQIKCLQIWYMHWEQEVPEWVYAFLKCKPVITSICNYSYRDTVHWKHVTKIHLIQSLECWSRAGQRLVKLSEILVKIYFEWPNVMVKSSPKSA